MNCKVKQCCAALAARKLAEHDPAVVEITRGGKNKSHHERSYPYTRWRYKVFCPCCPSLDLFKTPLLYPSHC